MLDKDQINDLKAKQFLEDLKQVGPYSKQILNYTYPPLLYQRGEDDEEDNEEDEEGAGNDHLMEDEDNAQEIQKIIAGAGGGIKNEDLYKKLS